MGKPMIMTPHVAREITKFCEHVIHALVPTVKAESRLTTLQHECVRDARRFIADVADHLTPGNENEPLCPISGLPERIFSGTIEGAELADELRDEPKPSCHRLNGCTCWPKLSPSNCKYWYATGR